MKHLRASSIHGNGRHGFTLLEVLIAMALTTLLVSAVYASLALYFRMTQQGQASLYHDRVSRALFRQMSRDIQSIRYFVPEAEASEDGEPLDDQDSLPEQNGDQVEAATELETQGPQPSKGLSGDERSLTLYISQPDREMSYEQFSSTAGVDVRRSDLVAVRYFLADPNADGVEGVVGRRAVQGKAGTAEASEIQGIVRLLSDQFLLDLTDPRLLQDEQLVFGARILAPEVVSLQFEYFDGLNWQTKWDTVESGSLPQAIAVTIGLRILASEEYREAARLDPNLPEPSADPVVFRRHVIVLPLTEPVTGEL